MKPLLPALALTLAAIAATPAFAETAPAPAATPTRLSVVAEGEGPDVMLIPGLASPRAVWDGTRAALGGKWRLHLVQVTGFGGEPAGANASGPMLPELVEQLAAHIRTRAPGRKVLVVGHSMGGLLALMLAKAHPELVARIMVVDALPWIGTILAPPGATPEQVTPFAAQLRDQLAARYGQPADPAREAANAARFALKPGARAQVAAWSAAADPRAVAQAFYEDMTTDLRGDIAAISVPITLVYPISTELPAAAADPLYRGAYASARQIGYEVIPDSYHFVMLDQPALFDAALRRFLEAR